MIAINCNTIDYIDIREPNIKTKKGHRIVHVRTDINRYILIGYKSKKTAKSMI